MRLAYQIFSSPLGEILVSGTDFAITHVQHGTNKTLLAAEFKMEHEEANSFGSSDYVKDGCAALSAYLQGKTQRIDIAFQADGTDFQRRVWRALRQIPYGKTVDYTAIAAVIGAPNAVRAVANACGSNPLPLIIPCHRVIQKNGSDGGFAWGAEAKRYLLELEKMNIAALSLAYS
jgi:AraC family transcriptional regulator of adaptative response/methylated-DNA-[protein]-cysteine methyltransferase